MLTRGQLIDEIRQVNGTADPGWLERFNESQLRSYLDHLQLTLEPRGRGSVWVRRPETPAMMVYEPAG